MPDPFEQVVEAMARHIAKRAWGEDFEEYEVPHHREEAAELLNLVIAQGQTTGLLTLVEERPDPACSDPNCSYRAEVGLLADECQGSGCRLRKSGDQPDTGRHDHWHFAESEQARRVPVELPGKPPGVGTPERSDVAPPAGSSGHHPEGEPSEQPLYQMAANGQIAPVLSRDECEALIWTLEGVQRGTDMDAITFSKALRTAQDKLRDAMSIDHPQDREAK